MTLTNLQQRYEGKTGRELVEAALRDFPAKTVLLSAFNPEDVILSQWISEIAPETPIIFLDTKKHFPETLRYVEAVIAQQGLKEVRMYAPRPELVENIDASGELWKTQVNRCCWLRKVEPVNRGIEEGGFEVLLTGRRKEQTPERHDMQAIELDEKGRFKINPLMDWTREARDAYMREHGLPHHPLYALGYLSIGCAPCTTPIFPGEDERAGRWRHTRLLEASGKGKTECGLHVGEESE